MARNLILWKSHVKGHCNINRAYFTGMDTHAHVLPILANVIYVYFLLHVNKHIGSYAAMIESHWCLNSTGNDSLIKERGTCKKSFSNSCLKWLIVW